MESKSWYQIGMEWRQNACHNVKIYVMTSKMHHVIKQYMKYVMMLTGMSWQQKVCHYVKK